MSRPVTLFTGQWADLPLETMCRKGAEFGYDGLELACWGDHFDVRQAAADDAYCQAKWKLLSDHGLVCYAVSNHLAGQAVCDRIDERHQSILPEHVWGDGEPEGVRQRAAEEMILTGKAAKRFFDMAPAPVKAKLDATGSYTVNGFTGSSVWPLLYSFPPNQPGQIDAGFEDFAKRWKPILDEYDKLGVNFALEVHPTEIAFDLVSTRRALAAIGEHKRFGFNYDPSHFGYQGVDYLRFIREFGERIFHVHVKDVWWSETPTAAGVFGGHTDFGDADRFWEFRSPGRGTIDFEGIIRLLNQVGYQGPLSVEWEDILMNREHGAREAAEFTRQLDFERSDIAFDAAFGDN
jgi:sugar phosphate isomerase/epimerase